MKKAPTQEAAQQAARFVASATLQMADMLVACHMGNWGEASSTGQDLVDVVTAFYALTTAQAAQANTRQRARRQLRSKLVVLPAAE